MKRLSESTSILVINNIRAIIDLFLGPFLAAYFLSSSIEALPRFIVQYIAMYLGCSILLPVIAKMSSGKFIHVILSIGITMELCILFWIVIAKDHILECVFLFGLARGIEEQVYWFPYNILRIDRVKDEDRLRFETAIVVSSKIIGITCPIILGSLIDSTNFTRTAIIVFALSVIQVLVSFTIKKPEYTKAFNLIGAIRLLPKKPKAVKIAVSELFSGAFEALPAAIFPALIFINNPTNLGLGIVSSISAATFIVVRIIYSKIAFRKAQKDADGTASRSRRLIMVCTVLCIVSALVYVIYSCLATIIIAYVIYIVCYGLVSIHINAKRLNFQHDPECEEIGKNEFWAIREFVLQVGRLVTFSLFLLIVVKWQNLLSLLFAVSIAMMAPFVIIQGRVHTVGE